MLNTLGAEITCLTPEQIDHLQGEQMTLDLDLSDVNNDFSINLHDFDSMITTGTAAQPTLTIDDTHWNHSGVWNISNNVFSSPVSGKIKLEGDDADIEINGESMVAVLKDIRDRLNIIQVSETMEAEWDELRDLREQYEAKLAECREKSRAWEALQQMPPPNIG